MFTTILLSFLAASSATPSSTDTTTDASSSAETAAPMTAADYLAQTSWVCHMPTHPRYAASICMPGPMARDCGVEWFASCSGLDGYFEPCNDRKCSDVEMRRMTSMVIPECRDWSPKRERNRGRR